MMLNEINIINSFFTWGNWDFKVHLSLDNKAMAKQLFKP